MAGLVAAAVRTDRFRSDMVASEVKSAARDGAYWRELILGRLVPALFFAVFVADQLIQLSLSVHTARTASDYLFVLRQLLALAYFTMLVVLYSTRQPAKGTDHRIAVIFVAFTGTFSAIGASFLPGGVRRELLVLPGDILATAGLAYSVWALAYLRRSFSIIPEARRLVTGGPYGLSRHPVYLGEIATAIGVNLATAGWLGALAVVYFIGAELLRMRWEERVLSRAFPEDYPLYAARVPRYFPNPLRPR
jgi:protein-S-isoprenylcysteine O-methyltransferase Ste14